MGTRLVPWLVSRGADVIAVGRDPARLDRLSGSTEFWPEGELGERLRSDQVDCVLDLAVLNSNASADLAAFRSANFFRVQALVAAARSAGVRRVVALSSYHAADPENHSSYAQSKRELEQWLATEPHGQARIVVLPKIIADETGIRRWAWRGLATAKPAAPFSAAAEAIEAAILTQEPASRPIWVASMGHHAGYDRLSRLIDIAFALAVILGGSWLMLLLAAAVRLDSEGAAIFRQQRVGRNERPFTLYKFRTMAMNTKEAGTHEVAGAAVTRLGALLRRFKLDELPQAWNILRGELALVGPRPCLLVQRELIEERRANGVFALRPGLTGLAQVNGVDMSDPRELVRWEVLYSRIRGLLLDIRIVWQTFAGRGNGDRIAP